MSQKNEFVFNALREEMIMDLNKHNIHALREKGVKLGVKSVTTHSKEKLVDLIIERKMVGQTSLEPNEAIENGFTLTEQERAELIEMSTNYIKRDGELVSGLLEFLENMDGILRLEDWNYCKQDVVVPKSVIIDFKLRFGDRVVVKAVNMQKHAFRAAIGVYTINGQSRSLVQRSDFSTMSATNSTTKLSLSVGKNKLLTEIDKKATMAIGHRSIFFSRVPMNRIELLAAVLRACRSKRVNTLVLCLSEKPESIASLKQEFSDSIISTGTESSLRDNQRIAQFALENLKRQAEMGKNVGLIISNMMSIFGEDGRGVVGDKFNYRTLFGSGRKLQEGGSLTVVAFSFLLGGMGERVYEALTPIANSVSVFVSDENGNPTLDLGLSYTDLNTKK